MREKEEKLEKMVLNESVKEKRKKDNEKVVRRLITMIILNALVNFPCKIPSAVISINDLRILISYSLENFQSMAWGAFSDYFVFPYTMKYLCMFEKICRIFQSFGNFLFLSSLSVNFFFYFNFDSKFKSAYEKFYGKLSKNKTNKNS